MSSNAALSAARRRRSNPLASGPGPAMNMQSHAAPANRILQRTGVPPPQFNPRMPPPPQHAQMRGAPLPSKPQGQGQGQVQFRQQPPQNQQQQQQHMARQATGLPPLPPPVKTAGPLYGIPIHPLLMFKTHDNKLSEHELSIGDCLEQLKEIDERLAAVESSSTGGGDHGSVSGADVEGAGAAAPAGDLNDLINDGAFINGVVDNIMNTTNFASIVDTIIPLKEENEALKQQVEGLNGQVERLNGQVERLNGKLEEWEERMRQLEDRIHHSTSSSETVIQEKNTAVCTDVNHVEEEVEGEGEKEGEEEES